MYCRECGSGDQKFVPKENAKCGHCGCSEFSVNRKVGSHKKQKQDVGHISAHRKAEADREFLGTREAMLSSSCYKMHPHASKSEYTIARTRPSTRGFSTPA